MVKPPDDFSMNIRSNTQIYKGSKDIDQGGLDFEQTV
jgi:hypothetical protein